MAQLADIEIQLQTLVAALSDAVLVVDADGRYLQVASTDPDLLVRPAEEMIGKTVRDLVPLAQAEALLGYIRTALHTRQAVHYEESLPVRGGEKWFEATIAPLSADTVLLIARDITTRKRTAEELQTGEARFRSAFDDAAIGMALVAPTGAYLRVNRAYCELTGYTEVELLSSTFQAITHPDDVDADVVALRQLIAGSIRTYDMEKRFIHKRGHAVWTWLSVSLVRDAHGRPLYTVSQVQDITERKQAEAALREREEQYRSVFESSTDGLFINDLAGRLVDFNPAAAHLHGYSVDEFRMLQPAQFIHPDSLYLFQNYIETVRRGEQFRCQAIDLRKDGTPFHVDVLGIRFTYGGQPHALAVLRDVTEQVQAQQLLEQRVTERTRELATLLDIAQHVASTLELEPLLGLILEQLKTLVDYTGAAVLMLQDGAFVILEYRGPMPREQARRVRFPAEVATINQDIVHRREPIIIDDVQADTPLAHTFREVAGTEFEASFGYIRSWLGVPLMSKDQAIGILGLDHAQPNYYTGQHARLATAIASQAALAIENTRLFTQVQGKAVLEERQRLARELHDSVTQSIYSATLLAEAGRRIIEDGENVQRAGRYFGEIGEITQQALREMRLLVYQLRPLALEREGLIGAIQARLDSVEKRAGVEARLVIEGRRARLPAAIEDGLFRITQEALNNALKHAAARAVLVRLRLEDDSITLDISDNGRGIDREQAGSRGGMGLISLQERAEQLHGTLTIQSAPGGGTHVQVEVPWTG